MDLSAFLLEPMQRMTRYPLLFKQLLHYSQYSPNTDDSLLPSSFKQVDLSLLEDPFERFSLSEVNPFSEVSEDNPFAEVVSDDPFKLHCNNKEDAVILAKAIYAAERILSRANEAAQRKENYNKLFDLAHKIGNIKLESFSKNNKKQRDKGTSLFIGHFREDESFNLLSDTKHFGARTLIKEGTVIDCKTKDKLFIILCNDILLITTVDHNDSKSLHLLYKVAT